MRSKLTLTIASLSVVLLAAYALFGVPKAHAGTTVTLDATQKFQTFRDWEATANLGFDPSLGPYVDGILDRLIDEAGITRIRVGVFSGDEKPYSYVDGYFAKTVDPETYRASRFNTINDNDDPFVINPSGFNFAELDIKMDNVVVPMLKKAKDRGKRLDINLNYVAFAKDVPPEDYIHTDPEEYAEFILATFQHLDQKYGVVPQYFEVLLEADHDNGKWTPPLLANAAGAAVRRLAAAGYHPKLIGPSTMDARQAVPWFDALMLDSAVAVQMAELSYHRYQGGKGEVLAQIAARAAKAGVDSSMLEFFEGKGTYEVLHSDLAVGRVSSWQGRAALGYYAPNGTVLQPAEDIRYLLEYMKSIRPGSQRIGAKSSSRNIMPLAFIGEDGRWSVVMRVVAPDTVTITGLPPGRYDVFAAVAKGSGAVASGVEPDKDGTLSFPAPGVGVVALRPAQ